MKTSLVMLRRWRSWQGKKIESLLSVGRKARGGAASQDHEMLEEGMLGEVNRYLNVQKNVQKLVILLDQER